jgi:hypothetical protein
MENVILPRHTLCSTCIYSLAIEKNRLKEKQKKDEEIKYIDYNIHRGRKREVEKKKTTRKI